MLPHEQAPSTCRRCDIDITLQTDALTLRPAHLVIDATSDDGTVDLHLAIDASHWDEDLVDRGADRPVATPAPCSH